MKISKKGKKKKTTGDIILHKCTKNLDNVLYCSWDMAHDRYNCFSTWSIFCPFTLLTIQKIKSQSRGPKMKKMKKKKKKKKTPKPGSKNQKNQKKKKKKKKPGDIISLHMCVKNLD